MTDTQPAPTTGPAGYMFRECTWHCYRTTTQHATSDGGWYCTRCGVRSDEA